MRRYKTSDATYNYIVCELFNFGENYNGNNIPIVTEDGLRIQRNTTLVFPWVSQETSKGVPFNNEKENLK